MGFVGREVADAGADVEREDAAAGSAFGGMLQGVGFRNVVGYLGMDLEAGDAGG